MSTHWMDAPNPNARRRPSFEQLLADYAAEHDVPLFKVTRVSSGSPDTRTVHLTDDDTAEIRRLWRTRTDLSVDDIARLYGVRPTAIYRRVSGRLRLGAA